MSGMSFIKKALGFAGNFVPALNVINKFLPDNNQLLDNTSAASIANAYDALPAETQLKIDKELEHELGMKKEETNQLEILAKVDMTGNSARPEGMLKMMNLLIVETMLFTLFLFVVLFKEGVAGLEGLAPLWIVFGIFTGTPATVILTYYNARTKEKRTRYAVAHGQSASLSGFSGIVTGLVGKWLNK